jgi:hypothetical protein
MPEIASVITCLPPLNLQALPRRLAALALHRPEQGVPAQYTETLATVQRIIRRQGGKIWSQAEPPQAALFTL